MKIGPKMILIIVHLEVKNGSRHIAALVLNFSLSSRAPLAGGAPCRGLVCVFDTDTVLLEGHYRNKLLWELIGDITYHECLCHCAEAEV